jgi:arylsulfatase A-like enzyme
MPPNVIVIMTDQQRADHRAAEGFELDTMPALDRWESEGCSFPVAYTTSPVCTPARCSMLTGRFPKATGIRALDAADHIRMETDLFGHLSLAGYETALIGKNHSHVTEDDVDHYRQYRHWSGPIRPENEEADRRFNEWMHSSSGPLMEAPCPLPLDQQFPCRIVDESIEWLKQDRDRPFCLWMSIPEPHSPYQVPEAYYDIFPPESLPQCTGPEALEGKPPLWRFNHKLELHHDPDRPEKTERYRSNYCGMLRLVDDQLARFFDFLSTSGLADSTLVVYTTDHGDFVGEYGLWSKGAGLPECLVRVPMIWQGPGVVSARPGSHVSLVDIFPTICGALELEVPEGIQGRSLWPILQGEPWPEEEFGSIYAENGVGGVPFKPDEVDRDAWPQLLGKPGESTFASELNSVSQSGHRKMVRRGRWKLVYDPYAPSELYDLETDPLELNNRYGAPEMTSLRNELIEELLRWSIRTEDTLPRERWPLKRREHLWDGLA